MANLSASGLRGSSHSGQAAQDWLKPLFPPAMLKKPDLVGVFEPGLQSSAIRYQPAGHRLGSWNKVKR
jgi:hypothetical protein